MELGKQSRYESEYNPKLLFPIARASNRNNIGIENALPFIGYDIWNHYEVSWLNLRGKPQVALAEIVYSCESEYLVESKSLKLYFNSLNNSRYENSRAVEDRVKRDLTACLQAPVSVSIKTLKEATLPTLSRLDGISIDDIEIDVTDFTAEAANLKTGQTIVTETLCSDLLKSNCPVTGQPDWGSVWISYTGLQIRREALLRYIVSFRNHHEFHEHCVERIFVDILRRCEPSALTVGARYTRRGGIDINPVRSTHPIATSNPRLIRQ